MGSRLNGVASDVILRDGCRVGGFLGSGFMAFIFSGLRFYGFEVSWVCMEQGFCAPHSCFWKGQGTFEEGGWQGRNGQG